MPGFYASTSLTPEAIADIVASHAIVVLLLLAALTMAGTALLWHLAQRYGTAAWRLAARAWAMLSSTRVGRTMRSLPLVGRLTSGTMTVGRYLGFYALAGFVTALAGLSLFLQVVDGIGADDSLARFDEALASSLRQHVSPSVLAAFARITWLGDLEFLVPLSAAVLAVLLFQRRLALARAWAGATLSGATLVAVLKAVFERTRPLHEHAPVVEKGWSFPSGHAFGAVLVYGLLGYVLILGTRPAWHRPIAVASACIVVFVGFSRVILQVHYASDVIAGYATGIAWVALSIAGVEAVRWRNRSRHS